MVVFNEIQVRSLPDLVCQIVIGDGQQQLRRRRSCRKLRQLQNDRLPSPDCSFEEHHPAVASLVRQMSLGVWR